MPEEVFEDSWPLDNLLMGNIVDELIGLPLDGMDDFSYSGSYSSSDPDSSPCSWTESPISSPDDYHKIPSPSDLLENKFKPKPSISKPTTKKSKGKPASEPGKLNVINLKAIDVHSPKVLCFSRSQLLQMSCQELEDIVSLVEKHRNLTPDELKEVKRQRRLIKNRESAHASRVRKREQMETLEDQTKALEDRNALLEQRVRMLEEENKMLRTQLEKANSNLWPRIGKAEIKPEPGYMQTSTTSCLYVVLLCIGIMLTSFHPGEMNAFPEKSGLSFSGQVISHNSVLTAKGTPVRFTNDMSLIPGYRELLMHQETLPKSVPGPSSQEEQVEIEQFGSFSRFARFQEESVFPNFESRNVVLQNSSPVALHDFDGSVPTTLDLFIPSNATNIEPLYVQAQVLRVSTEPLPALSVY